MVARSRQTTREFPASRWLTPPPLVPGATVGLIAPASAPADPAAVDRSITRLTELGFRVIPGAALRSRLGFLAGSDEDRVADLHQMFQDDAVQAIFCLRGGYGTTRLLPYLDYALIRKHPKLLIGYSDITALQLALLRCAGVRSIHGPVVAEIARPEFSSAALEHLLTLAKSRGKKFMPYGAADSREQVELLCPGKARGRLLGGNLALLTALLGTPYFPSLRGAIVFFEDVNEAPYQIDRMLTSLVLAGAFRGVAGIAVGVCRDCLEPGKQEYWQTTPEIVRERLRHLGVPIVYGLPFGHGAPHFALPQGGQAYLDGDRGTLAIGWHP